jgi:hypothetical protein
VARTRKHAIADKKRLALMRFYFDRMINGVGYPNLARHSATPYTISWRQFDHHWPRTVPMRLFLYLGKCGIHHESLEFNVECRGWYPIGLGWFDHDLDYFSMIQHPVLESIRKKKLRLMFYYHEADDPHRIKRRLDHLCEIHLLDPRCYVFISANTSAKTIPGFLYFPDHEIFFGYLNRKQSAQTVSNDHRSKKFTVLSRTHKSWRAACVSDLHRRGLLENSYWSYGVEGIDDDENPIEIETYPDWNQYMQHWFQGAPYSCDDFTPDQQNDHHWVNERLYTDSHINIILETHFDADGSGGSFITEKTFKPIKFGQMFVIVGPANSIAELRAMGYCTFDDYICHDYDGVIDNTQRWFAVREEIDRLSKINPDTQMSVVDQMRHNQQHYQERQIQAVRRLADQLQTLTP